jgi:glycosyltransferase involved in cell wall biosynthesis
MRIGFDARAIRHRIGIGTYSRNLLQKYAEAGIEMVVFVGDDQKHSIPRADTFTLVSANMDPVASSGKNAFRALVKSANIDLLHVPSPWAATPLPVPFVTTAHDVTPFIYPRSLPVTVRTQYKRELQKTLRSARRIITVSQILFSALSIYARLDPGRVRVIHNGVSTNFTPQTDVAVLSAARVRYSLPENFAFWAGDFRPEKNVLFLIQAWERLQKRLVAPPSLVLAGALKAEYRKLKHEVERRGLEGKVLFPGFIGDEDLPAVYSLATVFVFPSLAEGFGLPPLEAMACGTPCVVSNSSSLPEVAGAAGLLFDPTSLDSFEECVARILNDPELHCSLREAGLKQAQRFSWDKAAQETLAVYRSALED